MRVLGARPRFLHSTPNPLTAPAPRKALSPAQGPPCVERRTWSISSTQWTRSSAPRQGPASPGPTYRVCLVCRCHREATWHWDGWAKGDS